MTRDVHHAYRNLGYIGEGAYGVVVKAETITSTPPPTTTTTNQQQQEQQQQQHSPTPITDTITSTAAATSATAATASTTQLSIPRYVAIKQMNLSRDGVGIASDAYREIKLLRALHHPNIISLLHTSLNTTQREVDLVYDYAEHDLADIIRHHRTTQRPIDHRCIKSIVHQLLQGLSFLHSNWIIHRDIKPANLLIMGADNTLEHGRLKIADFGLARIVQSPIRTLDKDGEVVTIWYRAPELLLGSKHYTRAVDVWAVGCIMYELLALQPAFPGDEVKGGCGGGGGGGSGGRWQEAQMRKVMSVMGYVNVELWPNVIHCVHYNKLSVFNNVKDWPNKLYSRLPHIDRHSRCFHLLTQLLCYDPTKRITCDEAVEHGWFKELPAVSGNCFKMSTHEVAKYPVRQVKPLKRGRESGTSSSSGAAAGGGGGSGVSGSVVQVGGMAGGMKVSGSLDSGRVASREGEASAVAAGTAVAAGGQSDGSSSTGSKKRRL